MTRAVPHEVQRIHRTPPPMVRVGASEGPSQGSSLLLAAALMAATGIMIVWVGKSARAETA